MINKAKELAFQDDMIQQLLANSSSCRRANYFSIHLADVVMSVY